MSLAATVGRQPVMMFCMTVAAEHDQVFWFLLEQAVVGAMVGIESP